MVGDIIVFNQTLLDLGKAVHDFSTHTFRVGLITSAVTPAVDTADPRWGAGGTTDFSAQQVPLGTAYAGPVALASVAFALSGANAVLDCADVVVDKDEADGFLSARWGIVYNDSAAGKNAVLAVDLGTDRTNGTGPVQITINPVGLLAVRRPA